MDKKKRLRIQGFVIAFCSILFYVLADWCMQMWYTEFWEEILDVAGIALVLFGFILRISARGHKSEQSRQGHDLVQSGPYTLSRNPMYIGSLIIGSGISIMLFNAYILAAFILSWMGFYSYVVNKEEVYLSGMFQEKYAAFMRSTPRFFPRWERWRRMPELCRIKASWVRMEIPTLAGVFLGCYVGELLFDIRLFGVHELVEEFFEISFLVTALSLLFAWVFLDEIRENRNFRVTLDKAMHSGRFRVLPVILLGTIILTSCLVVWINFPASLTFDIQVSQSLQSGGSNETAQLFWMKMVSLPGDSIFRVWTVLIVVLGYLYTANPREGVCVSLALIADILNLVIKGVINRARPAGDMVSVWHNAHTPSFPSGHVVHFVVFFGFIFFSMFYVRKIPVALRIIIAGVSLALIHAIGVSRIYLGAHYASDIVAGYTVGVLFLTMLIYVYRSKFVQRQFPGTASPS